MCQYEKLSAGDQDTAQKANFQMEERNMTHASHQHEEEQISEVRCILERTSHASYS